MLMNLIKRSLRSNKKFFFVGAFEGKKKKKGFLRSKEKKPKIKIT